MGKNGITYDMPPEPEFDLENHNGDIEMRMLDLRDDLDELIDTVHTQWEQYWIEIAKVEEEFGDRYGRLRRLTIANLLTAGGLICTMLTKLMS